MAYGEDLLAALGRARSLRAQVAAWLTVARDHKGVVRAAQELSRAGTPHAEAVGALRDACAELIAKRLRAQPGDGELRGASLMVVDIISQYVLMESAGWIPERDSEAVATQLERLVKRGLYR